MLKAALLVALAAGAAARMDGDVASLDKAIAERVALRAHSAEGRQQLLLQSQAWHTELVENAAQAKQEQEEQGEGFKIKFVPANSSVYVPHKSSTFKVIPNQAFVLGYADNTHLQGFQGRDVVQLGEYSMMAPFGAVTDCNSPDFNGIDGIVGFGMPAPAGPPPPTPGGGGGGGMMGGMGGMMGSAMGAKAPPPSLPLPLLFSLTNGKDLGAGDKMLKRRAFSFVSGETKGEIHLGGYDPAAIEGDMFMTPCISTHDYSVVAMSLK